MNIKKLPYIIAEIGCNHNGSKDLAYKLVDEAAKIGVDAIKFQTFKAEKLVSVHAPKAEYQKNTTGSNETQLEMTKKLELPYIEYIELFSYVKSLGIDVFATAFDLESIEFLANHGMEIWKIPSGEITNLPFLEKISKQKGEIIISTGMATIEELEVAMNVLMQNKKMNEITILHCITEYPTPVTEMNIITISYLKEKFPRCRIGLSDHSKKDMAAILATTLGAEVIEKHFTLYNGLPGPDHEASANPEEMLNIVKKTKSIHDILGKVKLEPTEIEKKNISIARKSIVASKKIKVGEKFTANNLTTKRPGNGISPMKWYEVIGTTSSKNYEIDDLIEY